MLIASGCLIVTCLGSAVSLYCSYFNYPGGHALAEFNSYYSKLLEEDSSLEVPSLHIGLYPAQTGVSKFLHKPEWNVSKVKDLTDEELLQFTHIITEYPYVNGFGLLFAQQGFDHMSWKMRGPVLKDKVYVLERNDINTVRKLPPQSKCKSRDNL